MITRWACDVENQDCRGRCCTCMWICLRRWDQLCKVSFVSKKKKLNMYRNIFKLQPQFHPSRLNEAHSSPRSTLTHVNVIDATTSPNGVHLFQFQTDTFCFSEMCVTKFKISDDLSKTLTSRGRSTKTCFLSFLFFFFCVHWVLNAQLFGSLHQTRAQWSCTLLCLA